MNDKEKADLAFLSMEPPKNYETWKNIGISYEAAGGDHDTFLSWCSRDPDVTRKLFEHVDEGGRITAGTLFWHAANAG